MSVFSSVSEHLENPPSTWEVHKVGPRMWALTVSGDRFTLNVYGTRTAAQSARVGGFMFDLYNKETRWYAGESIPGWRDYADVMNEGPKRKA